MIARWDGMGWDGMIEGTAQHILDILVCFRSVLALEAIV